MAKSKAEPTPPKNIEAALKYLKSKHKSAFDADEPLRGISTGSLAVDLVTGIGGFPVGRLSEVFGWEACHHFRTHIHFTTFVPGAGNRPGRNEPRAQNCKGGTIERLYERFHRLPSRGKGKYHRPESLDAQFFVPSVNEDDRVFLNRVIDVVATGDRPCLTVKTKRGHTVTATAEHQFYTGLGFTALGDLRPGDQVMIHANTPHTGRAPHEASRKYFYVKNHPTASVKIVRDQKRGYENEYRQLYRSRAVVEAGMNGLTLETYLKRLNSPRDEDRVGLTFLRPDEHVHHKDENFLNDDPTNLQVISPVGHSRMHALERHNNLRFEAQPDVIESITPAGTHPTYDIKMASPFNNFVADKFVVHNSGKTTLCLQACATAQRNGVYVAYLDFERGVDLSYAERLGFITNDESKGLYLKPSTLEEGAIIIEKLVQTGEVPLIVADSVSAMVPKVEMEGKIDETGPLAARGRAMSAMLPRITKLIHGNTALVLVNQMRQKVETSFVPAYMKTKENTEQSSGGSALKFYSSLRLNMVQNKKGIEKETEEGFFSEKEVEKPTASLHTVHAFKNKVSTPYQRAPLYIRYDAARNLWGIDNVQTTMDIALATRIIEEKSSGIYVAEGEIVRGKESLFDFLLQNPKIYEQVEAKVFELPRVVEMLARQVQFS